MATTLKSLPSAKLSQMGGPERTSPGRRQRSHWSSISGLLAILVILPTTLASIHFIFLAHNRYQVEARFVVRTPASGLAGQLSGLVQGSSITHSVDDAYIVSAYMTSRDAMVALLETGKLLDILDYPKTDILWRYPGPLSAHNLERLYAHLKRMIDVQFDHVTGISKLTVQAFRPEDARFIAQTLIERAERLVNRISERGQSDAIKLAAQEVEASRSAAIAAHDRLTSFRTRHAVIDPGSTSSSAQSTITRLALERAQASTNITELEMSSPQSPQMDTLRIRMSALDKQVTKERELLAGSDRSLAPLISEYERLMLEREFAERTFGAAVASLEAARSDAQRQRLFLELVSQPGQPDYHSYPYRFLNIVIVFMVAWVSHRVVTRLIEDAVEHDGI